MSTNAAAVASVDPSTDPAGIEGLARALDRAERRRHIFGHSRMQHGGRTADAIRRETGE